MGIRQYRLICDHFNGLDGGLLNNEVIGQYYKERTGSTSIYISDSSFAVICTASKIKFERLTIKQVDSLNECLWLIYVKHCVPGKSKTSLNINVYDPNKNSTTTIKLKRAVFKSANVLIYPFKVEDIVCVGHIYDYLISYWLKSQKINDYDIKSLVMGVFKLSKKNLIDVEFPYNEIKRKFKSPKCIKLNKSKLEFIKFLGTVMDTKYYKHLLFYLSKVSTIDPESLEYISEICPRIKEEITIVEIKFSTLTKVLDNATSSFDSLNNKMYGTKVLKNKKVNRINRLIDENNEPFDITRLNPLIFDTYSIKQIMKLDDRNIIKVLIISLIKNNREDFSIITHKHLQIYCKGVEADWIIIALGHLLLKTSVFTRDGDILALGQINTIRTQENPLLMLRIMQTICTKKNKKLDLKRIIRCMFLTGSDYMDLKGFGGKTFIKGVDWILGKEVTKIQETKIKLAIRLYRENLAGIDSTVSLIHLDDAINAYVKCMDFYWKGGCYCNNCIIKAAIDKIRKPSKIILKSPKVAIIKASKVAT